VSSVATYSFAGLLGPAEPYAKPGSFSLSGGYSYVEQKVGSSGVGDVILKSNQYFVEGTYSPIKNWEGYLMGGGADMKVKDGDFKDDIRPFGGIGVRGLLYDNGFFGVGPVLQANFYSEWKDGRAKLKDAWDVTAGLAGQLKHRSSGFILYGGPYAYWTKMKAEGPVTSETLNEKGNVGVFVGIKCPVNNQLSVTGEARYLDRWSLGGMISFAF
jgi:hypothetical protein